MSRNSSTRLKIALRGPSGEPVDFRRTTLSHGLTSVAPFSVADDGRRLGAVVRLPDASVRVVELSEAASSSAGEGPLPPACHVRVHGPVLTSPERDALRATLVRTLALDIDLGPFYEDVADDPLLAWASEGAGRMVRSQTVFEDVVRTICTTNCAFSGTRRMINALVSELGDSAAETDWSGKAGPEPTRGRAFPTPSALASAGADLLREQARLGYRAEYVEAIARRTVEGDLDLEQLRPGRPDALDEDGARAALLELPGVGPYGAAHAMLLMGRYSTPVLDSWSRPAYARLAGRSVDDSAIARRFARYGEYAGLAFWLAVTRSWVAPTAAGSINGPAVEPV